MSGRPTFVFLLVASYSLLAVTGQQVLGTASVVRGRRADLRPFLALPAGDNCTTVRFVAREGVSCGLVVPSDFECTYSGIITYQHFGCFSGSVRADFQVQTREQSAAFLSVKIRVIPPDDASAAAKVFLVATKPTQGSLIPFRVVFPVNPVNIANCYYTVVQQIWFPLAGKVVLDGSISSQQLIPCGFSPTPSLAYQQVNKTRHPDYIPLRIVSWASGQPEVTYALAALLFEVGPPPALVSYIPALLSVRQLATTVLRPDGGTVHAGAPPRKLVYNLAANQQYGAFASFPPEQGAGGQIACAAFTEADLLAGNVAFWPLLGNASQRYNYTLLDFAGTVRGSGTIVVTSEQRNWSSPSLRRNEGLAVASGGSVAVGRPGIDLYYTASDLIVRLVQAPKYGCFHLMNTNSTCPTAIPDLPIKSFLNGCLLYTHFGTSKEFTDASVWVVVCSSCKPLELFVPIKVIQVMVTPPPPPFRPTTLVAYRGYAIPIDVPDLMLSGPGMVSQGLNNVTLTLNGTVGRISQPSMLQLNSTSTLFPYIPAALLLSRAVQLTALLNLTDIVDIRCWYVPPLNARYDQVTLRLGSWLHPLSVVVVINDSLSTAFVPSFAESVPYVTVNRPLPVSSDPMTFITPNFLQADGDSGDNIVFDVLAAPNYGKLCILTDTACGHSVVQFTQQNIDSHSLYYSPLNANGRMANDTFQFKVSFSNATISEQSQQYHSFRITPATMGAQPLQFWVMSGRRKVIAYSYFKQYCPSSPPHSLSFVVTSRPKHGYLNPPVRFTQLQLLNKNVTYTYNADGNCSDSFQFAVISHTCNTTGSMTIAISIVDPNSSDNNARIDPTELAVKGATKFPLEPSHFHVYSSFCLTFINFSITKGPSMGLLLLNRARLGTLVALGVNSSAFTYTDVSDGLLWYFLLPNAVSVGLDAVRDSFDFTVTDPAARSHIFPSERSVPRQNPPLFNIIIDLSCTSNCAVTLNSPKLLTNLSDGSFGTVFSADDIKVTGIAASQFKNVSIQLVMLPSVGKLNRGIFSLQDLKDGAVVYSGPLQVFGDEPLKMTDSFSFTVIATSANNPLFLTSKNTFYLQWCVTYFDPGQNLDVKESEGKITFVVRSVSLACCI